LGYFNTGKGNTVAVTSQVSITDGMQDIQKYQTKVMKQKCASVVGKPK